MMKKRGDAKLLKNSSVRSFYLLLKTFFSPSSPSVALSFPPWIFQSETMHQVNSQRPYKKKVALRQKKKKQNVKSKDSDNTPYGKVQKEDTGGGWEGLTIRGSHPEHDRFMGALSLPPLSPVTALSKPSLHCQIRAAGSKRNGEVSPLCLPV